MRIPLSRRLKKRVHVEIATLQDQIVDILYSFSAPVLHGGTAVWRCFNGNRFSEDLDFYAEVGRGFKEKIQNGLKGRELELLRYKDTQNNIFSKISNGFVEVQLEVSLRTPKEKIIAKYERVDGSYMDVYTLSAETLIMEKMSAYKQRRLIRDLYDIYHLSNFVEKNIPGMDEFLSSIKPAVDEKNLRVIIYSGVAPSFESMAKALRRRFG